MYLPDKQACGKGTVNGCLKDPVHIASIKEPAEKVQLAAVRKDLNTSATSRRLQ
ncbi:hypothetical protein NXY47_00045 [Bacteroides fragilis]|nr:hypothetical protein [Bacteroides fragilis]